MSADPALSGLGTLERLASRASGNVPADAVMPRRPSIFEPASDAATSGDSEEREREQPTRAAENVSAHNDRLASPAVLPGAVIQESGHRQSTTPAPPSTLAVAPNHHHTHRLVIERVPPATALPDRRDHPVAARAEPRTIRIESRIVERPIATLTDTPLFPEPASRSVAHERSTPPPQAPVMAARPAAAAVQPSVSAIQPARRHTEPYRDSRAADRSVVHVTIGRVEIRASSSTGKRDATAEARAARSESGLQTYLRRRALGGRS